ncbi:TPA: hypothetical protein QEL15_003687 [Stenotrophomonas maltophilia]|nr:hypothetical protein [Stenotrophomonas maltophilia]
MLRLGRRMMGASACLALLLLSACQAQTAQPRTEPSSSAAQSTVPLVRPFTLSSSAEPMVVEFNLEPPGRSATPTLLVAVRVSGEDGAVALERALMIRRAGLPARVLLTRLGEMGEENVPLVRVEQQLGAAATLVPINVDGHVSTVWLDDVDDTSLEVAGLSSPQEHYKQLAMAWGQNLSPGRYRLRVELLDPSARLASVPAELLVAYKHRSK